MCTFFTFFYVFFKIQKNMTFYVFFELLHTFSRTVYVMLLAPITIQRGKIRNHVEYKQCEVFLK